MIVRMLKVRILGPRAHLTRTIRTIQDAGVLHLAAAPERPQIHPFQLSAPQARRRKQLLRLLGDLDFGLQALGEPPGSITPGDGSISKLAGWARQAGRVRRRLITLSARAAALEEESALLARYGGFFRAFEALLRSHATGPGATAFHVVLRPEQAAMLPRLREALGQLLDGAYESFSQQLPGGELAVLILVPGATGARVEQLLSETRVQEIPLPAEYGGSLLEAIPRMRARTGEIPTELAALRREREELARVHGPEFAQARSAVRDRLLRLEALPLSGVTPHAFVLEGWLPARTEARLSDALEAAFGGEVVLELAREEQWRAEDAPVVLRNPRLFRPFEVLIGMVPLPRYGSLDPTPFVAVFFPMFFGLILGDIGYGLVLAGLALLFRHRSRVGSTRRAVAEVGGACAVFSLIFGLLFGECFGDLGHRLFGLRPLWMDRAEAIVPFLALSIALGVVHLVLGLVLGALTARRREPRLAIGRGLTALMLLLIVGAILAAMEVFPRALLTPMVVGLLVAFPALIVVEGVVAPVELLSTVGHVLSYARIMALGTASVMLAIVANRLAGAMGSAIVGALFALLFHLVNFSLALFTPTIHALRLHYVEFFGTFYSPGGVRYQPLHHWRPESGQFA